MAVPRFATMPDNLTDYLHALPDQRRVLVQTLIDLILSLYPDIEVSMKYKMPTFSLGVGWVSVANQKHYVSLYTCDYSHIAAFKRRHPMLKTGKGCINFKPAQALPLEDIKQVIHHALAHPHGA